MIFKAVWRIDYGGRIAFQCVVEGSVSKAVQIWKGDLRIVPDVIKGTRIHVTIDGFTRVAELAERIAPARSDIPVYWRCRCIDGKHEIVCVDEADIKSGFGKIEL
jgi:hypothetical protein